MAHGKPRVIAYVSGEGQHWTKWVPNKGKLISVHALLFADGSIWDTQNGWRPKTAWYTPLRIRQIRNIWRNEAKSNAEERSV